MTDTALLRARQLSRHFSLGKRRWPWRKGGKIRAVDGIDLVIDEASSVALVGESGCGKTTLSRLLLLLDTPSGGVVEFRGKNTAEMSAAEIAAFRRAVQPVFQDPFSSLDPRMTVGRIVAEPLRASGDLDTRAIRQRVADALRQVDLRPDDAGRMPVDFSGGQRQRIAIARALVSRPRIIVLDEAVSSQDVSIRAQILNLLKDIQEQQGVSYLFISHDLSTVRFLCQRIYVMYLGRIVECGDVDAVFDRPAHPYTLRLLNAWLPADPKAARAKQFAVEQGLTDSRLDTGCLFAPRCPVSVAQCAVARPALEALDETQEAACFLVGHDADSE